MTFFNDIYRGKRVLITGHTGFKGSWLTTWLLSLGAEVCGYSDKIPTPPSLFEASGLERLVRHEVGDIRDQSRFREVFSSFRPDYVFHLAAQAIVSTSYADPLDTIVTNVLGTANVLDALRNYSDPCIAVIITSDKAYHNVEWPWGYRETDRLGGKDIYSGSKGAAEIIFTSYFESFFKSPTSSIRIASARAGNVIGGGDAAADRIVADCIKAWMKEEQVILRCPTATRPWQHVLEPLSGYLTLGSALTRGRESHGESYNFGPNSEQNATVIELLEELASVWGFSKLGDAFRIANEVTFHEAGLLKLNIDKAISSFRWLPTLSYQECVKFTGDWYRNVMRLGRPAADMTRMQIDEYQARAQEKRRVWTM